MRRQRTLAPLTRADRIAAMFSDSANWNSDYIEQLLIDGGEDARTAIIASDALKKSSLFHFVMDHTGGRDLNPLVVQRIKTDDSAPISEPRNYCIAAY